MTTDLAAIHKLVSSLQANPKANANNVVHLTAAINNSKSTEAVVRAAVQGLKVYFVGASQDGDLANGDAQAAQQAGEAQDVFRQWLRRQYANYISALLGLLTGAKQPATLQVSATSALMEAVRCEGGVGVFSNTLYARILTAVVTSTGVKPEVYTLLFNKYFQFTDVRYYSLWTAKALAAKHAAKAPTSSPAGKQQQQQAGAAADAAAPPNGVNGNKAARTEAASIPGQAGREAQGAVEAALTGSEEEGEGPQVALEDLCRNLFDVLCALPAAGAPGGGKQAGGDAEEAPAVRSWCGAAEVGLVVGASDKNESARARRKRKAEEEGGVAAAPAQGLSGSRAAEQKALWANPKAHRRLFSEAWLSLLALPVPADIYRKVLLALHEQVIPHMINPNMLADFLTFSINQGGLVGMLALNGIFTLVTRHGLEYPAFYARLYSLLTPDVFAAKHRAQFFALADVFLSSGMVPAYTAAAFAKRFARLALRAPPAGAMLALAFIHNLVRRHPACSVLLHNPDAQAAGTGADKGKGKGSKGGKGKQQAQGADPFLEHEQDPANTRAVESSLWEVEALREHYCPQVSAFCAILDKDVSDRTKTTEVDLSPLLAASYASLFTTEVERRLKQVPIAFYQQAPAKLFDINCHDDFVGWEL